MTEHIYIILKMLKTLEDNNNLNIDININKLSEKTEISNEKLFNALIYIEKNNLATIGLYFGDSFWFNGVTPEGEVFISKNKPINKVLDFLTLIRGLI